MKLSGNVLSDGGIFWYMDNQAFKHHAYGPYERYFKRLLDIFCALLAVGFFWWLYIIVAVLVRWKLGSPVLFVQERPGRNEKIFRLYKFRSMTGEKNGAGELLPDALRLTKFGKWLRRTSLDELPEVFNILKGDMSVVGPRPQLVKDMVFMSPRQRMRHVVRPGLTGLAQINGRNDIDWEKKLEYDLKYVKKISFSEDVKIVVQTVWKAFFKQEGITMGELATAEDFGDYLLVRREIDRKEYEMKQVEAKRLTDALR